MKKILGTLALITLLSSCRYEEGPFINFTNVEKRIRGRWSVSTIYKNGEITDTETPSIVESKYAQYEFYKTNVLVINYFYNGVVYQSSGSWEFGKKKKTINAVFSHHQYYNISREYEIVKFKNKELKVRFKDENDVQWTMVLSLEYSFPYGM